MNMQNLMKQAQALQNEITKEKEKINKTIFEKDTELVYLKANGEKKLLEVKIKFDKLDEDDIEALEDVLLNEINKLFEKIDKETEKAMSKYGSALSGIF